MPRAEAEGIHALWYLADLKNTYISAVIYDLSSCAITTH
jgi:hypothetical protein